MHICFPCSRLFREGLAAPPPRVQDPGALGQGDRMGEASGRCQERLPGWADTGTLCLAAAGKRLGFGLPQALTTSSEGRSLLFLAGWEPSASGVNFPDAPCLNPGGD